MQKRDSVPNICSKYELLVGNLMLENKKPHEVNYQPKCHAYETETAIKTTLLKIHCILLTMPSPCD